MKVSTYGGKPASPDHNAQGCAATEAEDTAMDGEATHSGDQRRVAPSTQVGRTMPPPTAAVKERHGSLRRAPDGLAVVLIFL